MDLKNDKDTKAYNEYQLSASSRLIRITAAIAGILSLFLIIPDVINLTDDSSRAIVIAYRTSFFVIAALVAVNYKRIKTFKALSLIVTACEIVAIFTFFHIYTMYPDPDFMIQLLGTFTIIMFIFIIPNMWANMLFLSIAVGAGFLAYTYFRQGLGGQSGIESGHFVAAAVYIAVEIALCTVFAYSFNRYKRKEFLARIELERIYSTDPLTQIGNRVMLENEAKKWLDYCKRHGHELSLVLIDVDNLKQINDVHGHLAGDAILYETAQIMRAELRASDVCVRWGGDEFVLVLPHTGIDEARALTERIKESIQRHRFINDADVTCSFGISDMKEGLRLDEIINRADDRMYIAKKQGKHDAKAGIQM